MRTLFLIAACIVATFAVEAQKGKTLEGVWTLDSLKVVEIADNGTETIVEYITAKDNVPFIFNRIDLQSEKQCKLDCGLLKNLNGSYTVTSDTLHLQYDEISLAYSYKLDGNLILEGKFIGWDPNGLSTNYRVFMRFKKQLQS